MTGLPCSGFDALKLNYMAKIMSLDFGDNPPAMKAAVTTAIGHCPRSGQVERQPSSREMSSCLCRISGLLNILQPKAVLLLGDILTNTFAALTTKKVSGLAWPFVCQGTWIGKTYAFSRFPLLSEDPLEVRRSVAEAVTEWSILSSSIKQHIKHRDDNVDVVVSWNLGSRIWT